MLWRMSVVVKFFSVIIGSLPPSPLMKPTRTLIKLHGWKKG